MRARAHLFDATAEAPCDHPHPKCVTRWLLGVAVRRGVTHRGVHLLALLDSYADDDGVCWPKAATLSAEMGYDDPYSPALYRELGALEDAGVIETARAGPHDGRRARYRLLRPCAFAQHEQNGRVDPAATAGNTNKAAGKPVRNGRQNPQPNPQRSDQPNSQAGRGRGSASLGSGSEPSKSQRRPAPPNEPAPIRNPRDAAIRERIERLDDELRAGASADEVVEACRALRVKKMSLVTQRLKDRGVAWMCDLLAASNAARDHLGFVVHFLNNPDKFERPAATTRPARAPEDSFTRRLQAAGLLSDDDPAVRDYDADDGDEDGTRRVIEQARKDRLAVKAASSRDDDEPDPD